MEAQTRNRKRSRSPSFSKYRVAVRMGGPWADLLAGDRLRRKPAWPTNPTIPEKRKLIRLWVKTLYQLARGVQEAMGRSGHLPRNSAAAQDIEFQVSTASGNLAFTNVTPTSASVRLYGRRTAAYTSRTAEVQTTMEWPGPPPSAIHFRNPHTQTSTIGEQHGQMSETNEFVPEMLYETLMEAAQERIFAVIIVGNVAANPPAQLTTNGGLLTWNLHPQATYPNFPAYGGTLQVSAYSN